MRLPIKPDAGRYSFRQVVREDLSLLGVWLRTPEVVRWWGKPEEQAALLEEDLDEPAMVMQNRLFRWKTVCVCTALCRAHLATGPLCRSSFRIAVDRRLHRGSRHDWKGPRIGFLATPRHAVEACRGSGGSHRSRHPKPPCPSCIRKSRFPRRKGSHDGQRPGDVDDFRRLSPHPERTNPRWKGRHPAQK